MAALGPLFYGAMRLTGVTDQRSQATNLSVAATEQMRSLPYSEVGFYSTPQACANNSETPVTLSAPGPLDALPASSAVGHTTYTVVRCVYWSASSIPGSSDAYKQTVVRVSWTTPGGVVTVSQVSALYPGGSSSPVTAPATTVPTSSLNAPLTCTAVTNGTNPTSEIDLSWTAPLGGLVPSYYLVYYTTYQPAGAITASSNPYTTSPDIRALSWNVTVGPATMYYFQVVAVAPDGTVSDPSGTCSTATSSTASTSSTTGTTTTTTTVPASPTYSSNASATAVSLDLGGGSTPYTVTSPATSATNNGQGSNDPVVFQPTISIPGADSFLSVATATQIAEASTTGTSYSCAGVLSNGQTLTGGSFSGPCPVSGSGSGGISLNLEGLPGVGSAVGSLVSGLVLDMNSASSWASGSAGGGTLTGSASLSGATIVVTPTGGLVPTQTILLSLPSTLTSPADIVKAITTAIGGDPAVSSLAAPLQTALASALTLTGDYQSTGSGVLTVSALHIAVLTGTGDLAVSTVGANTTQPPPATTTTTSTTSSTTSTTTTTTVASCSVDSLVVNPSTGIDGGGVALTQSGTLADESSFRLSVNVTSGCSNVEVGYAPSGCQPGAVGCDTSYAPMTGSSGTFYGTAGTASTVWQVGTTTFTVFLGANPAPYSPLTQQQVILCTEKGTTGKC